MISHTYYWSYYYEVGAFIAAKIAYSFVQISDL